jgi:hypothetical protein
MATSSRKKASSKTARKSPRKTASRTPAKRKASPKRWSQRVTQESDALDLKRGGVHVAGPEENRGIAETLRGTQFAPQGRRLSLGAFDADVLCQSCRQDVAEDATRTAGARQGRIEAAVRERVTSSRHALRCRGPITTVVMIAPGSSPKSLTSSASLRRRVWVPAFAGTTKECLSRSLRKFPKPIFKQPSSRILAAQCVRGLPIPREPREGMERWEAPGHQPAPLRQVVNPPRAARHRAPKARRSASQRSHRPPGHRPFRGAPVQPAFALSAEGSLLESAPSPDRTRAG